MIQLSYNIFATYSLQQMPTLMPFTRIQHKQGETVSELSIQQTVASKEDQGLLLQCRLQSGNGSQNKHPLLFSSLMTTPPFPSCQLSH